MSSENIINMKKSDKCIHSIENTKCCKESFICYGGYCKNIKMNFY